MMLFSIGAMVGVMLGIAISAMLHVAAEGRYEVPLCKHHNNPVDCEQCGASHG